MSPHRREQIGDQKIEEYYWAGKMVVYVNNHATACSFSEAVAIAKRGEQVPLEQP